MRILGAVLLASLVLFAPAVAAAERRPAEHHQQRKLMKHKKLERLARRLRRFDKLVQRFDANGDGVVSAEEAPRQFRKLQRFDRNGDGWLDRDELRVRSRQ